MTDDAALFERLGWPVRVLEATGANLKITTPLDLELAAACSGNAELAAAAIQYGRGPQRQGSVLIAMAKGSPATTGMPRSSLRSAAPAQAETWFCVILWLLTAAEAAKAQARQLLQGAAQAPWVSSRSRR